MSLLRPLKIKTTSIFRPVFASPKWNFPYDIIFDIKTTSLMDIKTTSLMRPLLGSPKGSLYAEFTVYSKVVNLDGNNIVLA